MRIAFVTQPGHAVIPAAGSAEIWTDEVARRLVARGHAVTIFASRLRGEADVDRDGLEFRFVRHFAEGALGRVGRPLARVRGAGRPHFASSAFSLAYWVGIGRALRRGGYDVVHVSNYSQAVPVLRRLAPRTKIVLHMHCEWLLQLDERMIRRRLERTAAVIGCSDHLTNGVRARFPALADRCHTVANGTDVDALDTERDYRRPPRRVLFVGRISPEKGLHVLMDAFAALHAEHPGLELVLVGEEEAPDPSMLIRLSSDARVRELERFYARSYSDQLRERLTPEARADVHFTGVVPYAEIAAHYRDADVFVLPSFMEAFGMPLVEAQAAGLPVIGGRTGGIPFIVEDGVTGLLVEPGEVDQLTGALRRLLDEPELRASLATTGRTSARDRFGWDRVAGALEATMQDSLTVQSSGTTLSVRLGES